ncbi:MAG: dTMP kinase [Polyangiales bacterium]
MSIVVGPPGALVAIEGIDGAGKTTQSRRLAEALAADGYEVVRTHEPTDGPWGRRIRASGETGRLSPREEFEAFLEDRREHVRDLLAPSLEAGRVVLVDRYYFSSMAYQGARGLDPAVIRAENERVAPRPDLLVILEIEPAAGVARVNARGKGNLFEREDDLRRAAAIFDAITDPAPLRLDATRPEGELTKEILAALRGVLSHKKLG